MEGDSEGRSLKGQARQNQAQGLAFWNQRIIPGAVLLCSSPPPLLCPTPNAHTLAAAFLFMRNWIEMNKGPWKEKRSHKSPSLTLIHFPFIWFFPFGVSLPFSFYSITVIIWWPAGQIQPLGTFCLAQRKVESKVTRQILCGTYQIPLLSHFCSQWPRPAHCGHLRYLESCLAP